jgi:SAM-dependent methyltransferase
VSIIRATDQLQDTPQARIARCYDEAARADAAETDRHRGIENLALGALLPVHGLHLQSPVLDLGCGAGRLLDLCHILPGCYLGVDLSTELVREARRCHPQHAVRHGDMRELPRGLSRQAGTVVALEAADYLHPGEFALLLASLLRPGGRFLVLACANGHRPHRHARALDGLLHPWDPVAVVRELQEARMVAVQARPFSWPVRGLGQTVRAVAEAEYWRCLRGNALREPDPGYRFTLFSGAKALP